MKQEFKFYDIKHSVTSTDTVPHRLIQRLYYTGQAWHYESIWRSSISDTVLVAIRRDSFDHQSYGRASIFDFNNRKWNVVTDIPIMMLKCKSVSMFHQANLTDFEEDDERIMDETLLLR